MLAAHKILMKDLTKEAGVFRSKGVGIFAGKDLVHMAPPANRVPEFIDNLVTWLKNAEDVHPIVKSSVFHYEFEFIHPFEDGNGRMGRMWQTLILHEWKPIFAWLPIETLIKERQDEYYRVLGECDKDADSGKFVEFLAKAIYDTFIEIAKNDNDTEQVTEQVLKILEAMSDEKLSAKEIMDKIGIKHRPTFRQNYLIPATRLGLVKMTIPDKPNSSKQKYYRVKNMS